MRNLPDTHLACSLLISLGNSSGSGFILFKNNSFYLVTARHVLYDEKLELRTSEIDLTCQSRVPEDENFTIYRVDLNKTIPKYSKTDDIAIVKLGNGQKSNDENNTWIMTYVSGVELISSAKTDTILIQDDLVLKFDDVLVSNDVYVFGYPTSLGIEVSKQFDSLRPLARKGIVANVHRPLKTIILDCPVYPGNSGGPVIQVSYVDNRKKYNLIGVISQYIPYVQKWKNDRDKIEHKEYLNSGYSIATSMDCVFELIDNSFYNVTGTNST